MPDNRKELAHDIVTTILKNLEGRKGIGNELESIDHSIYDDMYETLVVLTTRLLEARYAGQGN